MADHPSLSVKDGQALVDKLAEVSANMRQAASLTDAFSQSVAQLFPPGAVIAPQPTTTVIGKKRGRVPKEGKRIKDPNAPKRPATSYIMFQNDIRDELRQKHPELPYKELLGKVSEAWSVLGEDQKKAYQNVADSNMAKYNRAVVDYKGTLNGHAVAAVASVAPTPELDEEDEADEEEAAPPAKKPKSAARARIPVPTPATESTDDDSDAASSASEGSDETTVAPPPPPAKASKPASSKEKKRKSKK